MLEFAAPLGFLALGALLVPLLIHLVRRPRQVVRLGSLRFLREDRFRVRSLHWRQWLLLALRCGVLAVLALLLAAPRWHGRPAAARWLLVSPRAALDPAARAEMERLQAEGFEARWLAAGFPKHAEELPGAPDELDAWSLLREADARVAAGSRAIVFGPTTARQFRGERPTLTRLEVSWRRTTDAIVEATRARAEAHVAILAADDRREDAAYLRAAFTAIGGVVFDERAPDWIFQLGAVTLPDALTPRVEAGAHRVTDPANADRVASVTRRFDAGGASVAVRQRTTLASGAAVLLDSVGEPLLTEEKSGRGWRWRFALRFHPDWSDWPLDGSFPAWWREQFFPVANAAGSIAPEQAAPAFAPTPSPPPLRSLAPVDLRAACWILALALFAIERAISARSLRGRLA